MKVKNNLNQKKTRFWLPTMAQAGAIEPVEDQSLVVIEKPGWGYLPHLSVVGAVGLLVISIGYTGTRHNLDWGSVLFWLGLLTIFVPFTIRLISADASRQERIGLVTVLGVLLYIVKVLQSPIAFTFHDEFAHWRTANDIMATGHLFNENSIIPVSPLYPGLQLVTTALMHETGLGIYGSGRIVLGLARMLLVVCLYLFFEEISGSERLAGLAALLYMGNPTYMFFSSQFAYESLALPLAGLVLFTAVRRNRETGANRLGLNILVIMGLGAVLVTHHLTAYALLTLLALWTLVAFGRSMVDKFFHHGGEKLTFRSLLHTSTRHVVETVKKGPSPSAEHWWQPGPGGTALLLAVGCITWLVYVATFTIGYLGPVLRNAVTEIIKLIAGEAAGRELFKGSAGDVAPLWEQLVGFGAVGLILLGLPFGLLYIWRHHRHNVMAVTLGIAALAYPATLAMRLTSAAWEVSNRTSEFIFVAVAYVLAYGMAWLWLSRRPGWEWTGAFAVIATIIFLGGTLVGWPPYGRMPGPYLVSADTRSVELKGISAALWAKDQLPLQYRVAADRINGLLMLSYGQHRTVTNVSDKVNVGWIVMTPQVGPDEINALKRGQIRYLVIDRRLSTALPQVGIYYEEGEPDSDVHKSPPPLSELMKFDGLNNVSRVYDNGDIIIYDVGGLSGVR